jgi:PhzF family phenazine biosynthesis protein
MHRFSVVDVFAAEPFTGNPAAVVILHDPADDAWMLNVAAEFNLSETAFPVPRPDGTWDLRWFTPTHEVDFCGHATMATAHVLMERTLHPNDQPITFHTRAVGDLGVHRDGEDLVLDGPPPPAHEIDPPHRQADIIGVDPVFVGSTHPDEQLVGNLFVVLASQADVTDLEPDADAIAALPHGGLIITAKADGHAYDCVSRYFTPRFGIDEDPVTASAHCTIGTYWTEALGRTGIHAHQASSRGGNLNITVGADRAHVAGKAVTMTTGELHH